MVKRVLPAKPQIASVGSCCLVGAISNTKLYVANLGDSRAVLGRRVSESKRTPVVAERLSTDHNVGVDEVRKEVVALHPDDSHVVVYTRGVWRIKGIIQVTFAFLKFNGSSILIEQILVLSLLLMNLLSSVNNQNLGEFCEIPHRLGSKTKHLL